MFVISSAGRPGRFASVAIRRLYMPDIMFNLITEKYEIAVGLPYLVQASSQRQAPTSDDTPTLHNKLKSLRRSSNSSTIQTFRKVDTSDPSTPHLSDETCLLVLPWEGEREYVVLFHLILVRQLYWTSDTHASNHNIYYNYN